MATTIDRYKLVLDTSGASSSLTSLKGTIAAAGAALASAFAISSITATSARFEDLRITLGILYKDTATGAKAFDQIKKFAAESVFSVENLTESVVKLKAAGLNPTIEQMKLFADVSSVSADSVGALQAITDLFARTTAGGLGLEDLNRLADRGIPVFTILKDTLGLSRLEITKVGQSAEGAGRILAALSDGLQDTFGGSSAARANSLSQAFSNFGDAVDNAFDAIGQAGLNEALGEATRSITTFIEENKALIKSIGEGLGTAITLVVNNIKILVAVMAAAFAGAVAVRIITLGAAALKLAAAFKAAAVAGTILQGVTGIGLVKVAAGIAAAGVAVLSINKMTDEATASVKGLNDETDKLNEGGPSDGPLSGKATTALSAHATALKAVLAPHQRFIDQAQKFVDTDYRTALEKANQRVVDAQIVMEQLHLAFKRSNGEVENFVFLLKGVTDELEAAEGAVVKLNEANKILTNDEKFAEYFKDLTESAQTQADQLAFNKRATEELTSAMMNGTISLEAYFNALEVVNENLGISKEALMDLTSTSLDFQRTLRASTEDAQREFAQLNMDPLERQIDEIQHTLNRDLGDTVRELENAKILNPELAKDYDAAIKNITIATKEAITAQQGLATQSYNTQRTFASGWKKAFNEYEDNATNAAKRAEQVFAKTTKGMEDMIVNFAKTGKFEFKSFVASLLEDLLRAQIQQSMASVFQLPALGGGTGTIGSQAGGMFGGFFATGGMIPPGRFGVVGENGPELVSGPANVTPNLGSGAVTYNINAVDARSFKELVAADPGFIHAVANKGASASPRRR